MKQEKTTLRPVPLSMRGKKRYILFELHSETGAALGRQDAINAVMAAMKDLYGSYGIAKFAIKFIDFDSASGRGIVRCAHTAVEEAKAGLLFVREAGGKKVIPKTLLTSGTIRKIKEAMAKQRK